MIMSENKYLLNSVAAYLESKIYENLLVQSMNLIQTAYTKAQLVKP